MAGQFLGDRQSRRRVGGIELADMRPTVPRHDVHTHTHDDAHLLVLHRGTYLSTARGMPAVCNEPVVLLNPPGTHHRDCFDSLDDARFLTVSLDSALWEQATAGAAVPSHASRLPALALPEAYRLWRRLIEFDDTSALAIEAEVQALLARSAGVSERAAEASGSAWMARARARLQDDVATCRASQSWPAKPACTRCISPARSGVPSAVPLATICASGGSTWPSRACAAARVRLPRSLATAASPTRAT